MKTATVRINTEKLRRDHYMSGLDPDMDCANHSPLLHRIGEPADGEPRRINVNNEEMTTLERLVAAEERIQRLKKTVNELIAFCNELEARLDKQSKAHGADGTV